MLERFNYIFDQIFPNDSNLRKIIFSSVPITFFGYQSFYLFFSGQDGYFSRMGSGIIAWAAIMISLQVRNLSKSSYQADKARIISHVSNIRNLDIVRDKQIRLELDLHTSQIIQISNHLGVPHPYNLATGEEIKRFCEDVDNRVRYNNYMDEFKKQQRYIDEFYMKFNNYSMVTESWIQLLFKLEIILIIWGTLQWGYGDIIVRWYHTGIWSP